ncbi:MAG: 50S ribosomal protein L28 [Clostridiaceae bacterium]|mgnify:FL=1|nr:50S ribosomal protein L28 [Clostridiaceae bacterium]
MAKCDICQKAIHFGRKITMTRSQISRRGLRQQKANVKRVRVMVNGTPRKMNVCTRCLRSDKIERA